MTRFLVFFWNKQGNVVGRPMYVTAESVTMAMRQVTIPAGTYEAVVHPVAPGKRVPVWHESPKWAPSTDWIDIN